MRKAHAPSQMKKNPKLPATEDAMSSSAASPSRTIGINADCVSTRLVAKTPIQGSRGGIHKHVPFRTPFKSPLKSPIHPPGSAASNNSQEAETRPALETAKPVHKDEDRDQDTSIAAQPARALKRVKLSTSTLHPVNTFQPPLLATKPPSDSLTTPPKEAINPVVNVSNTSEFDRCFSVMWRKKTNKKHHTWDDDGVLLIRGTTGVLKDTQGKDVAKGMIATPSDLQPGNEVSFCGRVVEIVSVVSIEDFKRGRCFMTPMSSAASTPAPQSALTPKFNKKHTLSVAQQYAEEAPRAFSPQPRHSPDTPGAIVMPRPSSDHPRLRNRTSAKRIPGQSGIVDVVVDPVLGQHLRPHQKEGVRFLYECMMQLKESISGQGVILADEMGLGKTLQTITLLWTLLKQSPFYEEEKAVIKRALIVCPASLILNWKREFKKWLGDERLKVFAVDAKSTLTDFTLGRVYPVMIIGYEKLRMVQEELKNAAFDIVICDEGHRLKTSNIKTALAIRSLPTRRRIILSGTPIQNDLGEFFSMIDFVNPGLFESYSAFKRVFEDPIVRSRQPGCSIAEADLGKERSLELTNITRQFILRRSANVNYEYLPARTDLVVFCPPSSLQARFYRRMIGSSFLKSCFSMDSSRHLTCITALRQLCNSPLLIKEQIEAAAREGATSDGLYAGLADLLPEIEEELVNPFLGGKLRFVSQFLEVIKSQTTERVVLVSSFTQTLDILQKLCESCGYGFYRLDGSTPTAKRQEYVEKFNAKARDKFVFLLSAKSGGVGLNLVGASRLVLFDVDWNPSVDQQAMARIHRDGQERNVFVYRLLSTGTIEEKIFQRQLTKIGLSDALMDDKAEEMNKFTTEQLKDLFTFHEDDSCQTHSLLGCDCIDSLSAGDSLLPQMLSRRSSSALSGRAAEERAQKELREWAHFNVQDWVAFPAQAQGEVVDQDGRTKASAVELASKDRVLWKVIERDLHLQSLILAKDTCGSGESGGSDSEECPKESSWQPRSTMAATSASSLSMHSAALPANYRGIVTFLFVKQLK